MSATTYEFTVPAGVSAPPLAIALVSGQGEVATKLQLD